MAWCEIYKKEYHPEAVTWRVFLSNGRREAPLEESQAIVSVLKPYLDLIEPTLDYHWIKWRFSKEEYKAMMGEGDGQAT